METIYEINQVDSEKDGKQRMEGRVVIEKVTFKFSIYPTTTSGYLYRAHMSILSPTDNRVLQVEGEKRQEIIDKLSENKKQNVVAGKRIRELMAIDEFFLSSDDPKDIKIKIIEKAHKMFGVYGNEIRAAQGKPLDTDISASRAYQARGARFIESISRRQDREKAMSQASMLKGMCDLLSDKPMREISVKDILNSVKMLNGNDKTKRRKLSLLKRFWNYCLSDHIVDGLNPVEEFLKENPGGKRRNARSRIRSEELPGHLEAEQERCMIKYVENHLEDGRSMAVLLLNGGCIPPAMQVKMSWSDVIIDQADPSNVRVCVRRDDCTWATHDYTRPLFRTEGWLVAKRYEYLCEKYGGPDEVDKLPIVSAKDDVTKTVVSKEITAYIRDTLLRSGVKNSTLAPSRNPDPSVGLGTQFLQKNYKAKLLECGLETDKGLMDFLQLKRIRSVTADNYRSFTSQDGQQYIRCVLDRFVSSSEPPADGKPKLRRISDKSGVTTIQMDRVGPQRCNNLEVSVILKKGQKYMVDSGKGIDGELFVLDMDSKEGARSGELSQLEVY